MEVCGVVCLRDNGMEGMFWECCVCVCVCDGVVGHVVCACVCVCV